MPENNAAPDDGDNDPASSSDMLRCYAFALGDEYEVANADVPFELPSGGDFHAAFPLEDGSVAVVIGDVVGHGEAAATHARTLCKAVGECLIEGLPPAEALGFVNAAAEMSPEFEGFATIFAGTVEPETGTLVYASGGHEPALLATPDEDKFGRLTGRPDTVHELDSTGPPLGVMGADEFQYAQRTATLEGGGTLLLYTDGVTEARRDRRGEFLGVVRLRRALARWLHLRPLPLVWRIIGYARAFSGHGRTLRDDAALLALRRRRRWRRL